jgi:hypothetical protein
MIFVKRGGDTRPLFILAPATRPVFILARWVESAPFRARWRGRGAGFRLLLTPVP